MRPIVAVNSEQKLLLMAEVNSNPSQSKDQAVKQAKEAIAKIDFRGFWEAVLSDTSKETEAYDRARALSRAHAGQHVLR